jgi:hypothetical protein
MDGERCRCRRRLCAQAPRLEPGPDIAADGLWPPTHTQTHILLREGFGVSFEMISAREVRPAPGLMDSLLTYQEETPPPLPLAWPTWTAPARTDISPRLQWSCVVNGPLVARLKPFTSETRNPPAQALKLLSLLASTH